MPAAGVALALAVKWLLRLGHQEAFAPRLIAKLTGPDRLLAMSWNQKDFKATMNQYFTIKRFALPRGVLRDLIASRVSRMAWRPSL